MKKKKKTAMICSETKINEKEYGWKSGLVCVGSIDCLFCKEIGLIYVILGLYRFYLALARKLAGGIGGPHK